MEASSWGQTGVEGGGGGVPSVGAGIRANACVRWWCRFRLINSAAREVLVKGGWARTEETGRAKAREKKGRK